MCIIASIAPVPFPMDTPHPEHFYALIEQAHKIYVASKAACPSDAVDHTSKSYIRGVYIDLHHKVRGILDTMDNCPTSALNCPDFRYTYADLQRISGRINKILEHMGEAYTAFSIASDYGRTPLFRLQTMLAAAHCLREATNEKTYSHVKLEECLYQVARLLEGRSDDDLHHTLTLAYYYGPFSAECFTNVRLRLEQEREGHIPYEAEALEAVLYARLGMKETAYGIWKSVLAYFPTSTYKKTRGYMEKLLMERAA